MNEGEANRLVTTSGHIHVDQGHILEEIDDAVQSLNAFEGRIKNELNNTGSKSQNEGEHEDEPSSKRRNITQCEQSLTPIAESTLRQYHEAKSRVRDFYKEQHENQTVSYNLQARINYKTRIRARMTIWDALCKLSKLIDDSDPDTELSQIDHALQTAEAIRADGKPRWMQLVGLIHDLGKILYFFESEGQWDVVGDTFPVGCKFSDAIIFHEFFEANPDSRHPIYSQELGIYEKNCGLDSVMISWGHDEYMYYIAKGQSTLKEEALAMIRYHSFYPWHRENAYRYLMNENDYRMLKAVQEFNQYDLYSKQNEKIIKSDELKLYYMELIDEYFPKKIIEF
ncbi:HER207Wp [Eremothecium sinecaudum]|uniref:Inositol oxygenase n=1 Tax=Eremothecium sinecaudum TaxID=45286 RepID=A0A0X8HU64_9SACH|nr:HER207Wp [Eremothecium sinecaudum]AMD21485.1 HER207Wp [Eremothecium sinecaudum]